MIFIKNKKGSTLIELMIIVAMLGDNGINFINGSYTYPPYHIVKYKKEYGAPATRSR